MAESGRKIKAAVAPRTTAEIAKYKALPKEWLQKECGLADGDNCIQIPYFDLDGTPLFSRQRPGKGGSPFHQPPNTKLQPYGLWRISDDRKKGTLYIVEGESDCWALWFHGLFALGLPGSSSAKALEKEHIVGVDKIYISQEPDRGGETFVRGLTDRLKALYFPGKILVMTMPSGIKDPSELHCLYPEHSAFAEQMDAVRASAHPPPKPQEPVPDVTALPTLAKPPDPPRRPQRKLTLLSSAEFFDKEYRLEWLIKGVLVRNQPAILGGPKKSLKTSLLVDLAYSLGSGTPFLGKFPCPNPARIILLSGESGEGTIQETARRVVAAKGIDPRKATVFLGFSLPQLSNLESLIELENLIADHCADVVIVDPLYLSLLAGGGKNTASASNLYEIGPLLAEVGARCIAAGATPILAHHYKLTRQNPYEEPQLEDLAFAGIQEFARQWVLLGRREKYEPGTGDHKLWMSVGGSAGHSGLWALNISEGVVNEEFGGRRWELAFETLGDVRAGKEFERDRASKEKRQARANEDEAAVLAAVDAGDPSGVQISCLSALAGISRTRAKEAVDRLVYARILERVPLAVKGGNGATQVAQGCRRPPEK